MTNLARLLAMSALCVGLTSAGAPAGVSETSPSETSAVLSVTLDGERVTLRAESVRLDTLLTEIALRSGVIVRFERGLNEVVTTRLDDMPLHEALRRILRDYNFTLEYRPTTGRRLAPLTGRLWVFRTGPATDVEPVPWLLGPSPAEREEAMIAAGETSDAGALISLEQGLADPDPDVREAAVEGIAELDGEAAGFLLQRALVHADKAIREAAADYLADRGL